MTPTLSRSDPGWPNGGHFSPKIAYICPKLQNYAIWPFGEADQNHTPDEYASYVTNLFQIRLKMAEWWPFQFPEFDKLGPKVKKICQIRPKMAEWWPFQFPEFDKFGPKVKKKLPGMPLLGHSQPGTRHRPFGAILLIGIWLGGRNLKGSLSHFPSITNYFDSFIQHDVLSVSDLVWLKNSNIFCVCRNYKKSFTKFYNLLIITAMTIACRCDVTRWKRRRDKLAPKRHLGGA